MNGIGRQSRSSLVAAIFCLATGVPTTSGASGSLSSSPMQLTSGEQQSLVSKACQEKFYLGVEKIVARKRNVSGRTEFYAEVLCESHSQFKNNPVHHIVYCDKDRGDWDCRRSEQAIRLKTGAQPLVYFENDIEVELAYEIALQLEAGKYYQGEEMPDAEKSICNIKHHADDNDTRIDDLLVAACGSKEILISTWCPQKACPRIIGTRLIT